MAAALLGWLLVLLSLIGGFFLGRYRRYASRPEPVRPARSEPRSRAVAVTTRAVSLPVSTGPVNLPSETDMRRPDSIPKGLR